VFCGNFEYDASESSVLRMFEKYGRVQRIDMKTGEQQRLSGGNNASLPHLGVYK
jgi:RNA recognition motif-containing protein